MHDGDRKLLEDFVLAGVMLASPIWSLWFSVFHQYGPEIAQTAGVSLAATQIIRNLLAIRKGKP